MDLVSRLMGRLQRCVSRPVLIAIPRSKVLTESATSSSQLFAKHFKLSEHVRLVPQ